MYIYVLFYAYSEFSRVFTHRSSWSYLCLCLYSYLYRNNIHWERFQMSFAHSLVSLNMNSFCLLHHLYVDFNSSITFIILLRIIFLKVNNVKINAFNLNNCSENFREYIKSTLMLRILLKYEYYSPRRPMATSFCSRE